MDVDEIEYWSLPTSSLVGGFEIRNKKTGSLFSPVLSHAVDALRYFSFKIVLTETDRIVGGSFCEIVSYLAELPADCPHDLVGRFEQLPAARRFCRYSKITDFQADDGPNLATLGEVDRSALIVEILFHYNASQIAEDDYNNKKLRKINPDLYERKVRAKTQLAVVAPAIVDFQPACLPSLFARFVNRRDCFYVRTE